MQQSRVRDDLWVRARDLPTTECRLWPGAHTRTGLQSFNLASSFLWDLRKAFSPSLGINVPLCPKTDPAALPGMDGEAEVELVGFHPPGGVFRKSPVTFISRNSQIRILWGNKSARSFGQGLMWGKEQEEALFCVSRRSRQENHWPFQAWGGSQADSSATLTGPRVCCVGSESSVDRPNVMTRQGRGITIL